MCSAQRGHEFGKQVEAVFFRDDFVRLACRQNRQCARAVCDFSVITKAGSAAADDFMGFQLRRVAVPSDAFLRCDTHEVIAEAAVAVRGGDEMFEFDTIELRMTVPGQCCTVYGFIRQVAYAGAELFKQVLRFHEGALPGM